MYLSTNFFLALGALLIGTFGGVYFLIEWLRHKHASALCWAIGFLCLFLFQIPTVLANAGVGFVVTNLGFFFSISVPISFVGLSSVYFGIRYLSGPVSRRTYLVFLVWLAVAILFFQNYFYINATFTSRLPLYGTILLFFFPVHILNLWALFSFNSANQFPKNRIYTLGVVSIVFSVLCGIGRNIVFLQGFAAYQPSFWFLALQPQILFWLQISGNIFFLVGFILLHKYMLSGHEQNR